MFAVRGFWANQSEAERAWPSPQFWKTFDWRLLDGDDHTSNSMDTPTGPQLWHSIVWQICEVPIVHSEVELGSDSLSFTKLFHRNVQNFDNHSLFIYFFNNWTVFNPQWPGRVTVKNQEELEGSKFIWGLISLDRICGALISLKPGLNVSVFQLSTMESSCWRIWKKPSSAFTVSEICSFLEEHLQWF